MGKGEEGGRDTNKQFLRAFIQDAKYLLIPQATGTHMLCFQRYAHTTEEEHPQQTPTHLTWGRTPWVYDELFFYPGSLLRDHHPSFPTHSWCIDYGDQGTRTSALAAGVRTVRAGCCCGRRGAATSEELSANLQWVPYPEMAPVAAEAGLYWSNASYVPGIAQGVQEFKFC